VILILQKKLADEPSSVVDLGPNDQNLFAGLAVHEVTVYTPDSRGIGYAEIDGVLTAKQLARIAQLADGIPTV
jgi:hypothetical protein